MVNGKDIEHYKKMRDDAKKQMLEIDKQHQEFKRWYSSLSEKDKETIICNMYHSFIFAHPINKGSNEDA